MSAYLHRLERISVRLDPTPTLTSIENNVTSQSHSDERPKTENELKRTVNGPETTRSNIVVQLGWQQGGMRSIDIGKIQHKACPKTRIKGLITKINKIN